MKKSNPIPFLKRLTDVFEWGNSNHQSYYHALITLLLCGYDTLTTAMRSFRGRDEVDAMFSTKEVSNEVVQEKHKVLEDLVNRWQSALPFDSHPEMLKEWEKSIVSTILNFTQNYSLSGDVDDCSLIQKDLIFHSDMQELFSSFRKKYSEFLSNELIEDLKLSENSCILNKAIDNTLSNLYKSSENLVNSGKKVIVIFDWFYQVNKFVCPIINSYRFNSLSYPLMDFLHKMCSKEFFEILEDSIEPEDLDIYLDKKIKIGFRSAINYSQSILNVINAYRNNIDVISSKLDDNSTIYIYPTISGLESPHFSSMHHSLSAFLNTYDEWSDVYDSLANK